MGQKVRTSKSMRRIQILNDFDKNVNDRHQKDQIIGKTECSGKNQNLFNGLTFSTTSLEFQTNRLRRDIPEGSRSGHSEVDDLTSRVTK